MNMRRMGFFLWLFAATYALTHLWFDSLISIPFSERLWTFYNDLLGGERPGIASDMELLTVLAIAIGISYMTGKGMARLWALRR